VVYCGRARTLSCPPPCSSPSTVRYTATSGCPTPDSRPNVSPRSHTAPPKGARIVVLDSNPILVSVSGVLRMAGYRVFQAYDGQAAIELCFQLPHIRLLILNTHVDGLNSLGLIEEVRDHHPAIPILHIDTHRADGLPTDIPTLTEPFTAAALMNCVAGLLAGPEPIPVAS